jgi:hypothetical protein
MESSFTIYPSLAVHSHPYYFSTYLSSTIKNYPKTYQMTIERTSPITGITRSIDIPVTSEQIKSWDKGLTIQAAFPNLSLQQREFMLIGVWESEWEELFYEDEKGLLIS